MTTEEVQSLERQIGESVIERAKLERKQRELNMALDSLNQIITNKGISKEENEAIERDNQKN